MARFVEDLALVLPIIAGTDGKDPGIVPMPLHDPKEVDLKALRVAVYADNGLHTPTQETAASVNAAAAVLTDAGSRVEEKRPKGLERIAEFNLTRADGADWVRRLLDQAGTTQCHPWIDQRWFKGARSMSASEFMSILEEVDRFRSDMLAFVQNYDAILCPVCAFPAQPHGASLTEDKLFSISYTYLHNLTGWPAAVVRAATSPEGLPIGVQIAARPWREDVALAVATRLETALGGWIAPPL